jgi:hypothetical protein
VNAPAMINDHIADATWNQFDGVLDSFDAFSELEGAQMNARTWYLVTAILLTALDLAVVVFQGWPVWTTGSSDFWNRGIFILLASLGATSLTNVWAQVVAAKDISLLDRSTEGEQSRASIQLEARGQADV